MFDGGGAGVLAPVESLFAKGDRIGWRWIDRDVLSHKFHSLDGQEIPFGSGIRRGSRVPALFTHRVLVGDLIPGSSWGSSLANLLTKSQWDVLRAPVIERNSGVCEFCGQLVGGLDVHEVWNYSELPSQAEMGSLRDDEVFFGRQTLMGLVGVCKACHACFHPGLAHVQGKLDAVRARLAVINGWDLEQVERYLDVLYERTEVFSSIHWRLDLSQIANQVEGLVVSSSWARDGGSDVLSRDSKRGYGESITVIVGIRWRTTKERDWTFIPADATKV